jgi:hypothetical protein
VISELPRKSPNACRYWATSVRLKRRPHRLDSYSVKMYGILSGGRVTTIKPITHPLLLLRLRIHGVSPSVPNKPSWLGAQELK